MQKWEGPYRKRARFPAERGIQALPRRSCVGLLPGQLVRRHGPLSSRDINTVNLFPATRKHSRRICALFDDAKWSG